MIEALILGVVQGVFEWLPVSSEGLITYVKITFFGDQSIIELIRIALFLHLGTFLAALIYFRREVLELAKSLIFYKTETIEKKVLIRFYIVATLTSSIVGYSILQFLTLFESTFFGLTGGIITASIGVLLLVTAFLQLLKKSAGERNETDATLIDGVIVGMSQGFAVLPGVSRSGVTIAALLLGKFSDTSALRMSFIMSLPVVLGANIVLNFNTSFLSIFNLNGLIGLFAAFFVGFITIHLFLALSRRINFGWFALSFGVFMLFAALLGL
jgi:undecaprenyl-diphosphatase